MQQLQSVWNTLNARQRILAAVVSVAMFAALFALGKMATSPNMALLYSGLEDAAAGEVIQALEARNLRYNVRGDSIFVPSDIRDETRLMLAASGLPSNTTSGYELLESLSGFGTTSQMFDAAYWRAKEGELARTIVASPHIRVARVHIAAASSAPFRREIAPTASVTVTTNGAALTAVQARSIRFLVASAVAGMTPEHVSVIDGTGGLVYGPEDDPSGKAHAADRAQELRRNVERLLEAHVGHGRAVVELSLETVTDREVIHERRLDPENRVAISSEIEESTAISTDTRRIGVTVASNLPDGDAADTDGTAQSRENQTRQRTNFEVSETRRELERQPGAIRRITVAVLIDGVRGTGPEGQDIWSPRPAEELEALRDLVASAVGFDEARGDVITLRSLPFEPITAQGVEVGTGLFSLAALDVMTILKWIFLLLALVLLALFVLRPLLQSFARQESADAFGNAAFAAEPAMLGADGSSFSAREGLVSDMTEELPEDPVDRLRRLIDARGQESVQVLRHWMDEKEEKT
ncbi:MAG: flagellar basal-body MS-ring/collar protein FliF [Roseinatronobacter sp.]